MKGAIRNPVEGLEDTDGVVVGVELGKDKASNAAAARSSRESETLEPCSPNNPNGIQA